MMCRCEGVTMCRYEGVTMCRCGGGQCAGVRV